MKEEGYEANCFSKIGCREAKKRMKKSGNISACTFGGTGNMGCWRKY